MKDKILTLEQLSCVAAENHAAGRTIVATNGCFDLLHLGHVRYLAEAARLGDLLVVGVNGDESVRLLKGPDRPVNCAAERAEVLAALACVTYVAIFPEKRATNFLEAAQPDFYAKGGDYSIETLDPEERSILERIGSRLAIIPFHAGYSTSNLLTKIERDS